MITALLIGAGALYLLRKKHNEAIGKVERVKRRIYKEVSLAQQAGVDFSKKFPELTTQERSALERVGKQVGWKQSKRSIESGKPYVESYYGSLRRAWNAVSGIAGIGATSYDVYDRDGNVCLTWTDVTDHIEHEPEAKVLLALPPHVEKKTKKAKKNAEYEERLAFATDFIDNWLKEHRDSWLATGKERNIDTPIPSLDNITGRELLINEFANGTLKWRQDKRYKNFPDNIEWYTKAEDQRKKLDWEGDSKGWIDGGKADNAYGQIVFELIEGWNNRYVTDGFAREDLDEIRKDLLDKAKHMHVSLPEDVYREERDNLSEESGNGYVRGNDRYNYLPYINWIYFVHMKYANGEETYYPKFSFNTKEDAMKYQHGYYANIKDKPDHGAGWKIIPVWDVPIEKITGLN